MTKPHRRLRFSRDTVIFALGIAGIIYETVWDHADKPSLMVLFSACIGLPAFLHADEASRKPKDDPPKVEPPKQESTSPPSGVEK